MHRKTLTLLLASRTLGNLQHFPASTCGTLLAPRYNALHKDADGKSSLE
jgi:hypothetical protein